MCRQTRFYWSICKHITRDTQLCSQAQGEAPCGNLSKTDIGKHAHCLKCIAQMHYITLNEAKPVQALVVKSNERFGRQYHLLGVAGTQHEMAREEAAQHDREPDAEAMQVIIQKAFIRLHERLTDRLNANSSRRGSRIGRRAAEARSRMGSETRRR
ncbi:hypothetical protein PVAG01_07088 [Phlyctema vagabunda]|uniref:Uncharacterized protein n=1 Tax=Phlyctema vagabunda TaxID=108571 RepID=A0ABR4PBF1_9HELO